MPLSSSLFIAISIIFSTNCQSAWWCLCCNSLELPGLSARVKQGVTELYDESLSLAAAQTTTDPKNKIQITQRTNALHLRHHHLSKNLVWNVLMIFQKKCFLLSLVRGPVLLLLLLYCHSCWILVARVSAFTRTAFLISSDLDTRPIFLPHIQFYCFKLCQEEMKCSSSDNYRPLLVTTTRNKSYISCENVKNRTLHRGARGFYLSFDYIQSTLFGSPYT